MSYLEPALGFFLLLAVIGVIRVWRVSKDRKPWLLAFSISGLILLSMSPAAWLFSRPLEVWYDQNPLPTTEPEAIVVLAGAVSSPLPLRPYALAGSDTYMRVHHAVWLFKNWARLPILVSGGGHDSAAYSNTMRHLLEAEGIPSDMIWVEDRSRSTYENALYSSQILKKHGIAQVALVIDARSMLRAEASFTRQGITVVPAPFRFYNLDLSLQDILPSWRAIQANGETAHEILGLLWYRLRGWI